jgi:lysophospholipase L1-like esterase
MRVAKHDGTRWPFQELAATLEAHLGHGASVDASFRWNRMPNQRSMLQRPCVVACLGSSSTAGKGQAFNWIAELQQRLLGTRYVIRNFGVGGDLAYNALQRLPAVIASQPQKTIVFIGGNDALALVSRKASRFFRIFKRLPCEPTPEWFRKNLHAIVRSCKAETSAEIALCSLPPIGEDPASSNHFQSELNRRIEEFSAVIGDIAFEEDVGYIPLYEAILVQINESPGRTFSEFRFLPFYRDAFRTLVLRKTPDEVARMNGWRFHTDGVHLNSRSGLIVADLVQTFIEKTQ